MAETDRRERRVVLEGARNFRDLGGYAAAGGLRVRWGKLYRSDRLSDLTDADHHVLGRLDLALVCDLRDDRERAESPNRLAAPVSPEVENIPVVVRAGDEMARLLTDGERDLSSLRRVMARGYREFVDLHRTEWANLFRAVLGAQSGSVLVHCSAGQDRTGFASALMLLALGVSRDVVIEDYMLTDLYRPGETAVEDIESGPVPASLVAEAWRVGPELLEASFEAMESGYGSTDGYLASIGLDDRACATLRDRLLI